MGLISFFLIHPLKNLQKFFFELITLILDPNGSSFIFFLFGSLYTLALRILLYELVLCI